jgi:hypothetical protein
MVRTANQKRFVWSKVLLIFGVCLIVASLALMLMSAYLEGHSGSNTDSLRTLIHDTLKYQSGLSLWDVIGQLTGNAQAGNKLLLKLSLFPIFLYPCQPYFLGAGLALTILGILLRIGARSGKRKERTKAARRPNSAPRYTTYCPQCGQALGADDLFCGRCGTRI